MILFRIHDEKVALGWYREAAENYKKLQETLDTELVALRSKCERLEHRLERVEMKLGLESV